MSKNPHSFTSRKDQNAIQKLMDDLKNVKSGTLTASQTDVEDLSLIIDDALKGVDVAKRYPSVYQKLLGSAELRQAFLDTLDLMEKDQAGKLVPLPKLIKPKLAFLTILPVQPTLSN